MLAKIIFIVLISATLNSCAILRGSIQGEEGKLYAECVILLHGMVVLGFSMLKLEECLLRSNYKVVNFGYPSTHETIEQIAKIQIPNAVAQCQNVSTKKIHFVTHSLGGIVVRQYLQTHTLPKGSRIVMLSPPNQGSEIADHFKDAFWYQWSTGLAGQQLTTADSSLPNQLKAVNTEVGIIAGTKSIEPWFSSLIPGRDDGKVSVEKARLKEMKDFLVIPHTHTFIMWPSEVLKQIGHFLKYGQFDRKTE